MSNAIVRRDQSTALARPGELRDPITGLSVDVFPQNYGPRERGMVMAVCDRYGLDPIAREVELLHGQIFITAKGINRIATQDPAFDGIEVEVVREDWDKGFFVVKASAWRKGCAHPVEEYADSDGSKMRGGARFRHTITRAKARALRAAFAIPFCSKEELDDTDTPRFEAPPARSHQSQPTPQPTIEPISPPADPDAHPGAGWQAANKATRGVLHRAGITEDERKLLLSHFWHRESFKELRAKHLNKLASAIEDGPTDEDRNYERQSKEMIEAAGGELGIDEAAQMRDLAKTPWQVVLLDRLFAGGEG